MTKTQTIDARAVRIAARIARQPRPPARWSGPRVDVHRRARTGSGRRPRRVHAQLSSARQRAADAHVQRSTSACGAGSRRPSWARIRRRRGCTYAPPSKPPVPASSIGSQLAHRRTHSGRSRGVDPSVKICGPGSSACAGAASASAASSARQQRGAPHGQRDPALRARARAGELGLAEPGARDRPAHDLADRAEAEAPGPLRGRVMRTSSGRRRRPSGPRSRARGRCRRAARARGRACRSGGSGPRRACALSARSTVSLATRTPPPEPPGP